LRKYALEYLNNETSKTEKNYKSSELKTHQIIKFLPAAIEELKKVVGEKTYYDILRKFWGGQKENSDLTENFRENCSNSNTLCNKNMITINLCDNCRSKLREQLKKKIYAKLIQNQIHNTQNSQKFHNSQNSSSFLNDTSQSNHNEVLNNFSQRLKNTGLKIESIKELLTSFIQNVV
jgi:hypothetical protein